MSSTSVIDPAAPAVDGVLPLVSQGFTVGDPASADPVASAVEWGIYGVSGFSPGNLPLYLDLDLSGSSGSVWLALADYDSESWSWQPLDLSAATSFAITFPQNRQLFQQEAGTCFLILAVSTGGTLRFHGGHLTGSQALSTGLHVTHRSGQSFITWPEDGSLTNETYRVYRHTASLEAGNLTEAELLYVVPEGSGKFYADRYRLDEDAEWEPRYLDRYVISDFGSELPVGTGLLVWTTQTGQAGANIYYGVTIVDSMGTEDASGLLENLAFGPIAESVAEPLPVEVLVEDDGRAHLFVQYMDLADWNPTYDAPNALNDYYGLSPLDWQASHAIQYAYCYIVSEPDPANLAGMPRNNPVIMYLHGWGGGEFRPELSGSGWYSSMQILPIDYNNSWFFGFARDHDYRSPAGFDASDVIVNYTEQRVLRMLYDTLRHPRLGSLIDTQRMYLYGGSMGGSGTLAMAQRYPNVFACAYAALSMTDYAASTEWLPFLSGKWGEPALALPIVSAGPGNWAEHLAVMDGTSIWEWQDHQQQLSLRRGTDMVPLGIKHGRLDEIISWTTQGKPVYSILNSTNQCWGGAVLDIGHESYDWEGLPGGLMHLESGSPFGGMRVVRDESVPGLSNASGDAALPPSDGPGDPGYWNRSIQWSASWDDWDGPPIDEPTYWELSLRTMNATIKQVDITPRRLQRFLVEAGGLYSWSNIRIVDDTLIDTGLVSPDADGLLVVPRFRITPTGNRLILVRIE